jgi:ribosomal protein S18 acetylase RimI-like enzyme
MKVDMVNILKQFDLNSKYRFLPLDIDNYVDKLIENAIIINEIRESKLVAFIAYYANDYKLKKAYLSIVIVNESYKGIGLAKKLLSLAIKNLENTGFKYFDLHVLENNTKAISLYRDLEFEVVENVDEKLLMRKVL